MKNYYLVLAVVLTATLVGVLALPQGASAHSHSVFQIGDKTYSFTVGSLNEPVAVDDKTGVSVTINELPGGFTGDNHDDGIPVEGLEGDIQVELIAGDQTRVLELEPAFGEPGAYDATFIPTVQTTYTYRVFGEINGVDVDLSFSCNPAGHPQSEAETDSIDVSPGVEQLEKTGAFGCPAAKAGLGFPEPSASLYDLQQEVDSKSSSSMGTAALVVGIVGLIAGSAALMRNKK